MSQLDRVRQLAELMSDQKKRVTNLTDELKDAKEAFMRTEREDLPELMREVGLPMMGLATGEVIELVDDVDCAITEANREAAHRWLIDNGFGGLIKTLVEVSFDRGEQEEAQEFAEQAAAMSSRPAVAKESVHSSTLKSFVKEQMEKGAAVPFDLFSIRPYSKAKISKKK